MKILWLSHFVPYPPAGGALQRSFHLLRHAAAQHEVHLIALHQPRLLPTQAGLTEAIEALSGLCASVRVLAMRSERSAIHRAVALATSVVGRSSFDVVWLRSSEMRREVAAWNSDPSLDLVHVDTIGLWPDVAGFTRAPVVLGHHNIESNLVARRAAHEQRPWRSVLMRRDAEKLRRLERSAASSAAINIVVSQLDARDLAVIAPSARVGVVENGVDTSYWVPGAEAPRPNALVFAGTLGWYPNRDAVDYLLADIWPLLASGDSNRSLVLVGRDPPPSALAAAATGRVTATGFVPDVRPYLRAASIYVCTIRVGGGTRLKILDALAMGIPIVSTDIGVEGLDLVDESHYLRANTPSEFVSQIGRLERDPELRRRLSVAGRSCAVDRYDWKAVGTRLDAAYAMARKSILA